MQISGHNIKFTYNKKQNDMTHAVNGVSFNIEEGTCTCVIGKTGSGKSTLVQTLNALILPDDGYTQVDDFFVTNNKQLKKDLLKDKDKNIKKANKKYVSLKKEVGLVFQFPEYQLFSMTVLKDVMFGPKNFGLKEKEAEDCAKEALKEVGLDESFYDRSPFVLSGGEKRRVAIAGILASNPKVIVLDEPTAGLDARGKKEIVDLLKDFQKKGRTLVLVTHDMDIVMKLANKVLVMNEGKIVIETTPSELFRMDDIEQYSIEIPRIYKLIKLLKNSGFAGNLEEIDDYDTLIKEIVNVKGEKK